VKHGSDLGARQAWEFVYQNGLDQVEAAGARASAAASVSSSGRQASVCTRGAKGLFRVRTEGDVRLPCTSNPEVRELEHGA
jgi:hypothetical protein